MPYIVINENEIVKAEMERPERPHPAPPDWNIDTFIQARKKFQHHCLSLPRISIEGKHKWKLWQEVVEGKDFKWKYEIDLKGHGDYDPCDKITYNTFLGYKQVIAIPIQPTPEGEKVPCNQCGGKLASVRGRYPGDPERMVCPTCVVEELESLKQNNSTAKNTTNDNL